MLNRTEITTDGSWLRSHFGVLDRVRYQELARRVQPAVPDQGERKYASQSLSLPNPGLAIVAARRAFTRDRPLPPGGVLLGIGLKYGDGWDCVDGTEYKCEVEEVLDRRGRLRMTIDVSMRSPGRTSSPALVGFTLLWPKETETYIADNQTKSLEPKVGIVKAPVGEQIASLTLERERIRAWAELSADDNPLHTDTAFAATTRFEVPIVHGHLLVCIAVEELMSRVAFTSVNATFHAPVPVGSHIAILWDPDAALARIIIPGAEGPAVELHVEGALMCRTRTHDTEQTVIRNGQGDEPNN